MSKSKNLSLSRGLSQHGLPKTPGLLSFDDSVRSSRFGGASPPLSPRSFLSLLHSKDIARSNNALLTAPQKRPLSTPEAVPSVPQLDARKSYAQPCQTCCSCSKEMGSPDSNKENERSDEIDTLTKLTRRIKTVLATKSKEEILEPKKPRRPKQRLQRVETTHWTEM